MDTYLKQVVARALSKVVDPNEALVMVEEASDRRFLENLVEIIRNKYQGESIKILRRVEAMLEMRDPVVAERFRRVYRR
jgi:hypothetical protein